MLGCICHAGTWLTGSLLAGSIIWFGPHCMALFTTLASSCDAPGEAKAVVLVRTACAMKGLLLRCGTGTST